MPVLTIYEDNKKLKSFKFSSGRPVTIGRLENNSIVLDNQAVSNFHAELEGEGGQYFITDYQSRNGTFVNKELVISRQLSHGDRITIHPYTLVFSYAEGEEQESPRNNVSRATMQIDTSDHRSRLARSMSEVARIDSRKQKTGCLEFLNSDREPYFLQKEDPTSIGKSRDCDIVVKGLMVGATAAEISAASGGYLLKYAGGIRKPRVNYQPVSREVSLNELDIIEVGSEVMQFHYRSQPFEPEKERTEEIELAESEEKEGEGSGAPGEDS